MNRMRTRCGGLCGAAVLLILLVTPALAGDTKEIENQVDAALKRFESEVGGGARLLQGAEGVLVFPALHRAGFGIGGEYGEGALRVQGKTVDYYNTLAASMGYELGTQAKTFILVFQQEKALKRFRANGGWKAGVDGSVVAVIANGGGALDPDTAGHPIVGFILDQKGRMHAPDLDGSRFTRLDKS